MFNAFSMTQIDMAFIGTFLVLFFILVLFLIIRAIQNKATDKVIKNEFDKLNSSNVVEEKLASEEAVSKVEETSEPKVVAAPVVVEEVSEPVEETPVVEEEEAPVEETSEPEVVEEAPVEEASEPEVVEEAPVVESKEDVKVVEEVSSESEEETPEKKGRTYDGKYEIYQENNYYRYRLKASNGEVLFVSEMYASRVTVLKSIEAIKRNLDAGKTQVFVDKKKNYKFKLVAANHRVLAISANYPSEKGAQSALESFKRFALTNDIVDIELPAEQIDSQLVEIKKIKEEDKKGSKFVIKKDINGEFSWEFKANNGEILCQSSGYSSKGSVDNAIAAFKENVSSGKFYLSKDKSDNYQFKLYSQSGRLANVGESFDSSNAVYSVVTSILNFIELATISDKSTASTAKKPAAKKTTK